MFRVLAAILIVDASCAGIAWAADVDYATHIKPLLREKCYACHGALQQKSELRVDTGSLLQNGGASGAAIIPGKPDDSLLIAAVTGKAGFRMPPPDAGTPLTSEEVDMLIRWIREGAAIPADERPQPGPREWWSYQPIRRPQPPDVTAPAWPGNAIDRFVAARRDQRGLGHVADASKSIWLRRVHLDLVGLPPTRTERIAFLQDDSPRAYESVVDELLSRPQYGERWGRHWMDIWRYSDWYGSRRINEIRYSQRRIWRWRDWIVESLNADRGYDQMIMEMLAGDELAPDDPDVLAATGFLGRNWYKFDRNVWMFETVERTSEAFLGLTLRCCRCHDHKYDPVAQKDYYRFRAFFEPHDVRTDVLSALTAPEKDATQGMVPGDGIARVFDKQPDAPTYRFIRGDSRFPDESQPLSPGVPAALGGDLPAITPVTLPPGGYYPLLRPGVRETLPAAAAVAVATAQRERDDLQKSARDIAMMIAERSVDGAEALTDTEPATPFLTDDFAKPNAEFWQTLNGKWEYTDGKLVEQNVTSFATMVTKQNHPADFRVQLKYRPLQPGGVRSVGFSFDFVDKGNSQDVYTSTGDTRQSVQAFHRTDGRQVYPKAGIVRTELKVGELATLDVSVRGSRLTIDLNGERKLDYTLPVKRRQGRFALWVHNGSAEFHEVTITPYRETLQSLQDKHRGVVQATVLAEHNLLIAQAEFDSMKARVAADVAVHFAKDQSRSARLKRAAARAQRNVTVLKAQLECMKLEQQASLTASPPQQLQSKLEAARKTAADARAAMEVPAEDYEPVGEQFPSTSTGRRLALANWIASRSNPRTARVAANHIWNRHFGQPLVATTQNFGLNGKEPTHPQLLDFLASELIPQDWSMKPIHRLIVLSRTYRMSSAGGPANARSVDPYNDYLWRMNSRRMEAEVVRDSVLSLAGRLNLQPGGPEISENDGEKVLRRSLYFRNTPNEKMPLLETFDVADPNACYRRKESVVPHQALALMNSGLAQDHARHIAHELGSPANGEQPLRDEQFAVIAFETILGRLPTSYETDRAAQFLREHAEMLQNTTTAFPDGGSSRRPPAASASMRARKT